MRKKGFIFGIMAVMFLFAGMPQDAKAQVKAVFYKDGSLSGDSITITQLNSDYVGDSWNDCISAIKVFPNVCIDFFEHGNYGGRSGKYCNISDAPIVTQLGWNDQISSYKITKLPNKPLIQPTNEEQKIGYYDIDRLVKIYDYKNPCGIVWQESHLQNTRIWNQLNTYRDDKIIKLLNGASDELGRDMVRYIEVEKIIEAGKYVANDYRALENTLRKETLNAERDCEYFRRRCREVADIFASQYNMKYIMGVDTNVYSRLKEIAGLTDFTEQMIEWIKDNDIQRSDDDEDDD